jgi:DNA primase
MAKRPAPSKQEPEPQAITLERRASILTAFCEVARLREWQIPSSCPALAYLERRGISAATAQACGLGWVGDYRRASEWLLARNPLEDLQSAGLFSKKTGNLTPYRHRLLIPYWLDGQVFALQVRNIDWKEGDGRKELTCGPVTIPFNADVLLGEPGEVFITEGAIDCLSLVEQGLAAVAIPGVAGFKPQWVGMFEGWKPIIAFDGDGPGRVAAEKVAGFFTQAGQAVRVLELPDGTDINDLLRAA